MNRPQLRSVFQFHLAVQFLAILAIAALLIPSVGRAQSTKINLNTATADELAGVPGISKRKAGKIIANRPYGSADDLKKAGFSSKQIEKLTPLVSFEGGSAAAPAAAPTSAAAPAATAETKAHKSKSTATAESTTAQTPPSPGMVWATPSSKVYHVEGSRYYGNTKTGQWMTEADAIKDGYRKSKR